MSVIIINTKKNLSTTHTKLKSALLEGPNQTTTNHYYGVSTFPIKYEKKISVK